MAQDVTYKGRNKRMFAWLTWKLAAGIVIGGGLGYAYHRLVGCSTGACPITANPWISTIYGVTLGAFTTWGAK